MERYKKLFNLQSDLYHEGSGVIIEAGALLLDTKTDSTVAQLKFKNITSKRIKGIQISLNCFDIGGKELQGIDEFQYLDLDILPNQEFGSKTPINLPVANTRSFSIKDCTIYYEDTTQCKLGSVWESLKKATVKSGSVELKKQYKIEFGENAQYKYDKYQDLWYCVCGSVNREENATCICCRVKRERIELLDDKQIESKMLARVAHEDEIAKEAREKEERERIEKERIEIERKQENAKKRKKIIKISVFFAIIIAVLAYTIPTYAVPFVKNYIAYQDAKEMLENGLYDDAKKKFESLGGFFDAEEMVFEAQYQKANLLAENDQYESAIEIWESIIEYSDSATCIETAKTNWTEYNYQDALLLMEEAKYYEAFDAFAALGDYKDSRVKKEECLELQMQVAVDALEAKDYITAIDIITTLGNNKYDYYVGDLYESACYQYACHLTEQKDYKKAIEYFGYARGYQDASEKEIEVTYLYGCYLFERRDYKAAVEAFNNCEGYEDTDKKVLEAQYEYVLAHQNANDNTTYEYLNNLIDENYMNSKALFKEIYKWEMEVTAFNTSENSSYDMSSISKYSEWYCHVKMQGGVPGECTRVKFVATFPDGDTYSDWWDFEFLRGDTAYCYFWYDTPQYGSTGTLTVKFYDENGNLIGKDSVQITT
ncbi:MAG: hypothetical protein IJZ42_10365 [Lachnospiraceae bacterium]|nr:hypothetical protein [Lachnospiraceae bacterium]